MINIMDLAARYLPDLEKLAAGISTQYSNVSSDTEESEGYYRKRRPLRRAKPAKKKKKGVNIKKKLHLPKRSDAVVIRKPLKWAGIKKQQNKNVKTCTKKKSSTQKVQVLQKSQKPKTEKVVKPKTTAPKIAPIEAKKVKAVEKYDRNKITKAITDFKKQRTQFINSLQTLQVELSNIKIPASIAATSTSVVPKKAIKTKKKVSPKHKKSKRKKSADGQSEESSSDSSESSGSDSSSESDSSSTESSESSSESDSSSSEEEPKKIAKPKRGKLLSKNTVNLTRHEKQAVEENKSPSDSKPEIDLPSTLSVTKMKNSFTLKNSGWPVDNHPVTVAEDVKTVPNKNEDIKRKAEMPTSSTFSKTMKSKHSRDIEMSIEKSQIDIHVMKQFLPKCTIYRGRQRKKED